MPLNADMGDRFNLYYALFEQKRLGVWDEDMWGPVEQDILGVFTDATIGEEARRYWESTKTNYTSEFQSCIERVLR